MAFRFKWLKNICFGLDEVKSIAEDHGSKTNFPNVKSFCIEIHK
jgi:hypothetical protein